MKKIFIAVLFITLFSFKTNEVKKLKVELTQEQWVKHFNKLSVIRQIADESNLSNQQVKFITRTIDSLEMELIPQLRPQIDTSKKK